MLSRSLFSDGWLWDPWRQLSALQDEVNRAFVGHEGAQYGHGLPLNVWSNDDGVLVVGEVPGIDAANLDVQVKGDTLTIRVTRQGDAEKERTWLRRERFTGTQTRTLQLPFQIDAKGVEAELRHGVLTIRAPLADQDKPFRVQVKH